MGETGDESTAGSSGRQEIARFGGNPVRIHRPDEARLLFKAGLNRHRLRPLEIGERAELDVDRGD